MPGGREDWASVGASRLVYVAEDSSPPGSLLDKLAGTVAGRGMGAGLAESWPWAGKLADKTLRSSGSRRTVVVFIIS
jgi:hypothetical protein